MPRLHLVRHARPAAGWGESADPGLDALGHTQAHAMAQSLAATLSPRPLHTSPLQRCRETAQPLAARWRGEAIVFPAVAELPSPPLDLQARHAWLMHAMTGTWSQLQAEAPPGSPDFLAWRHGLLAALAALEADSVICSHFVAINAVVGAALGRDDVVCFRPDHASVTCVDIDGGAVRIVALGREAGTAVAAGQAARPAP